MKETITTARGTLITPMEEGVLATLWQIVSVVQVESCGKVSEEWLSACANERALMTELLQL